MPKSTAGSTPVEEATVPALDYGGQEEGRGIKTRGEYAESMRSGEQQQRRVPKTTLASGNSDAQRGKRLSIDKVSHQSIHAPTEKSRQLMLKEQWV